MATYTVASGDTLGDIASQYGVGVSAISGYSSGNPNLIFPGEELTINTPAPGVGGSLPVMDGAALTSPPPNLDIPETVPLGTPTIPPQAGAPLVQPTSFYNDTTIEGQLENAYNQVYTKGAETQKLEEENNIPGLTTEIADLNTEIATKKAAYDQAQVDITGKPIGIERQTGKLAQIQRNASVELNGLSALLLAKQGQLDAANALVERTIELEFEPVYAQIEALKDFYDINQDKLSESDKKSITSSIATQEANANALEQAKKDAYTIALDNLVPSSVVTAITNAKTIEDIYAAISSLPGTEDFMDTHRAEDPAITSWVSLIQSGEETISNVPSELRTDVTIALASAESGVSYETYSAQISTYESKDKAMEELELYKDEIIANIGQEGYDKLVEEVNAFFGESGSSGSVFQAPSATSVATGTAQDVAGGVLGPAASIGKTISSIFNSLFK